MFMASSLRRCFSRSAGKPGKDDPDVLSSDSIVKPADIVSFDRAPETERNAQADEKGVGQPQEEHDPNVVTWDGPNDPANPMNWSPGKKWTATILVSCFTFISPFSSTMITPALGEIGDEFDIAEGFSQKLVMSIFLLGYAQGPFLLAPLSEIYGRLSILQLANLIYLAFNTACGFSQNRSQILAFRFLSGVGGSAPQALCNGVLADVWSKEERGKGQAIYGMLTFIGPTVAPIVGAFMAESISWRWIFWATSIFDVWVQVTAFCFLDETYAPSILAKKAARIRKETGNDAIRTQYDDPDKTFSAIVRRRLVLPFIMFVAHPAVQAPSIYRAFLYGIMYLVLSTFGEVWEDDYDFNEGIASLHYLSLCLGFLIGLQISHPLMDGLYAWFKKRNKTNEGVPEWRIPPMLLGGILVPIGLLIYGWSAQHKVFWLVPDIGCVILAMGLIIAFQSAQAYVVDAYGPAHSASAAAIGAFERTMCGFAFPLFASQMYDALGLGWGNSLLAFVTLALAIPSPILLWMYGSKIRSWSTAGL